MSPLGTRESPALPAGTRIEFEVECRSSPDAPAGSSHAATLLEEWTVATPHDLRAEQVGLAFGGFCDCLALADSGIRVAQRWWQLATRRVIPEVAFHPWLGWQPSAAPGCDCTPSSGMDGTGLRFRTARDVLAHEMSVPHLAARHRARPHHVGALVDALRPLTVGARPGRRTWEPVADRFREPDALQLLWDCGLHPGEATGLLDVAASVTGRVPWVLPLGLAYVPDRARSRRHEIRRQRDADLASWLVWDGTAPDPSHPVESGEWLALGLTPQATRTLTQLRATATVADRLATVFEEPPEDAARRLLGWARLGALPDMDELLRLGGHRFAPSADEFERARGLLSEQPGCDVPTTLLALLISERGKAVEAVEAVEALRVSPAVGGPRQTHRSHPHDHDLFQEEPDGHPQPG